jgi:hypothetical protein
MFVPKTVKNGFSSVSRVQVSLESLIPEWKSRTSIKTKKGNHFT